VASAGGFVYRLNPALGTVERASDAFGPFFTERAVRVGRRQGFFGFAYQRSHFTTLQGASLSAAPVTDRTDVDTPTPPVADRGMSPVNLASTNSAATTHVPTTSAEVPSPPPIVDDRDRIRDLVRRYESAYDQRHVGAVAGLWAEVDRGALTRAFERLSEQDLVLGECDVSIGGDSATARCPGTLRYVPRVGRPLPRAEELSWTFSLQREAAAWRIRAVSADR
jgi:hypothetical protein